MAILKLKWDLSLVVVSEEHGCRIVLLCGWGLCSMISIKRIFKKVFYIGLFTGLKPVRQKFMDHCGMVQT